MYCYIPAEQGQRRLVGMIVCKVKTHGLTLLLYITVNTTTIQYNANATYFGLEHSSSG